MLWNQPSHSRVASATTTTKIEAEDKAPQEAVVTMFRNKVILEESPKELCHSFSLRGCWVKSGNINKKLRPLSLLFFSGTPLLSLHSTSVVLFILLSALWTSNRHYDHGPNHHHPVITTNNQFPSSFCLCHFHPLYTHSIDMAEKGLSEEIPCHHWTHHEIENYITETQNNNIKWKECRTELSPEKRHDE